MVILNFGLIMTHKKFYLAALRSARPRAAHYKVRKHEPRRPRPFRITPRVHEVRAARKRLRFRGRSNLVEPDEVSGGR